MKRILLVLICLIFSSGLAFADHTSKYASKYKQKDKESRYPSGFFWLEGDNLKFVHKAYSPRKFNKAGKSLTDIIGDPKKKIIVVYNHGGGWGQSFQKKNEKKSRLMAFAKLSGVKVGDKEIIMWNNKIMGKAGGEGMDDSVGIHRKCGGWWPGSPTPATPEFMKKIDEQVDRLYPKYHDCVYGAMRTFEFNWLKRLDLTIEVFEEFAKEGVPPKNLFITGISAGGGDSIYMAAKYGNGKLLNAGIPIHPGMWDDTPVSPYRLWLFGLAKNTENNSLPILFMQSDIDTMMAYAANYNWVEPWLKKISDTEFVKLPGYNEKGKILLDGKDCKVPRQQGRGGGFINLVGGKEWGWKKVGVFENGKVIIDDGKTAKKRKSWANAHEFFNSACSTHYHPQIIDFITRRMQ